MYTEILGNLTRQAKGLELLEALQLEEFGLLMSLNMEEVGVLEFSVHELLRQLAVERDDLKKTMQGVKVMDYASMLPEEEGRRVRAMCKIIDAGEQRCARQAERNSSISLALLDQSHRLMTSLHERITPRPQTVYGARGAYINPRPAAAILNGRL
jgi:hypothetical protein